MRMRAVAAVALLTAVLPASADAQIRFCGPSDRACARLTVPLDYSGQVPGNVSLYLERTRAKRATRPPLFLLAGGPGQSATRAFADADVRGVFKRVVRQRDVVVLDQRGTGGSGALRCSALQRSSARDPSMAVAQCAALLGPARAFYTTADAVADLDAVRAALGYQRIALFAVSYGTQLALDYAATHPDRVDRLVLDSTVPLSGPDPLYRSSFTATPRVLRDLCRGGCRGVTPDPVRDLERLVQRLQRGRLNGAVVTPDGRRRRASLTRFGLFSTLAAGDLRPFLRVRVPAALRSAIAGDLAPLLRLARLAGQGIAPGPRSLSVATFAATTCEESPLPWDRAAPIDQRLAQARSQVQALPPVAFAPFDAATALDSDVIGLCERWPTTRQIVGAGPLPDVPVLVLSGSQDIRTPEEDARRVAGLFAHAQTVEVPGVGHSVVGSDPGGCAARAVRRFLGERRVARGCAAARPHPTPRDPTSLRAVRPAPGTRGRPGRTLAAVRRTYQDGLGTFFDLLLEAAAVDPDRAGSLRYADGGLRSGSYVFSLNRAVLRKLVYVPGVRVSGRLTSVAILPGGLLHVGGRAAARGTLRVRSGVLSGRLGGHRVHGRLGPDLLDLVFDISALGQQAGASSTAGGFVVDPRRVLRHIEPPI